MRPPDLHTLYTHYMTRVIVISDAGTAELHVSYRRYLREHLLFGAVKSRMMHLY